MNSSFGAVIEGNRFAQTIGRAGVLNSIGASSNNTFMMATGEACSWTKPLGSLGTWVQRGMIVENNVFERLRIAVPLQCNARGLKATTLRPGTIRLMVRA